MQLPTAFKRHQLPALISIAILLFYTVVSMSIGFLGDDWRYLYEMQKTAQPFNYVLHPYVTAFAWRPVSDLVWVSNYIVAGTHAWVYHLVNVLLFITTLWVIYHVVRTIASERIALWTAVLFSVMPIHYETILWISGRTDSVAFLLFLCSLLTYMRFRLAKKHAGSYLATSVALFAFALFSKESIILAPVIFFLVDQLFTAPHASLRQRLLPLVPHITVVGVFMMTRTFVVGGFITNNASFAETYSILPRVEHLCDTVRALSYIFNQSTVSAWMAQFSTVWTWGILPIACIIFLIITFAQKPWRNKTLGRLLLLSVTIFLLLCVPVFSLMQHVTPDLKHIRFLYAPSFGIALFLASVLCQDALHTKKSSLRHMQRIALIVLTGVWSIAGVINAHPWVSATEQTGAFLETFANAYPEYITTATPTVVYMLHTPAEYRGAYLFHDYYSLQQATVQTFQNPALTVQTAGTHAASPAPFCNDTIPSDVHVVSWNGSSFDTRDDLIEGWADPTEFAPFTLRTGSDWQKASLRARDLQYHINGDVLSIDHFGDHPQLHISMPQESAVHHWKTLTLNTTAQKPILFSWNTPKAKSATFQSILVEPNAESVALCSYPNWIVGGGLEEIALTFRPGTQEEITIQSLSLH